MDSLTPATSLHAKLRERYDAEPMVLRVTRNANVDLPERHALLNGPDAINRFAATLATTTRNSTNALHFTLPSELHYLNEGDIIRLNPDRGQLWVMYRKDSPHNSVLLTERCNSWCVMCSQPPRKTDDSHLIGDWKDAISLMSPKTTEIGFTGGEPLLLGEDFFHLLELCKTHLPNTSIHVLSNGRLFNYCSYAKRLSDIDLNDFMIGIPLYSDIAWRHDFVVQTPNAFDQTIRGILNLARCDIPIEIRVVIHRHTIDRLPELAAFIARNLPFVEHVALMGLEPIGFGRTNLEALWVDPADCRNELTQAVEMLQQHGLTTSIYNYQLCVLPEPLWPHARQSISDWKNIFLPICESCSVRERCAGFFHSATDAHSSHISPITEYADSSIES
jgi:His-Xaa-Ser system radical SAM maturase HxsC